MAPPDSAASHSTTQRFLCAKLGPSPHRHGLLPAPARLKPEPFLRSRTSFLSSSVLSFATFSNLRFAELGAYVQSIIGGITYGSVGRSSRLFALYGIALAIIGYMASPAVLSLEEMASGCRSERRTPIRPKSVGASA